MEVSIAYQGGGARLIELMAAALACRRIEDTKKIKVVRSSGASAGAIAAAMYATGCDLEKVVRHIKDLKGEVELKFPPGRLRQVPAFLRLARGKPVYDEQDVRAVLLKMFAFGGVDASRPVRELIKGDSQLRILRSDIHIHATSNVTEKSEAALVDALVDSAAIPFVFRTPKTTQHPELLDGGLFQNLPGRVAADDLAPDQVVLAFSFEKVISKNIGKQSLLDYGKAIVSSLIDERVEDAVFGIKESNVIRLAHRRETLDFSSIFSEDAVDTFADEVVDIEGRIKQWLRSQFGSNGPDWHSSHPQDVAAVAAAMRRQVMSFFDVVKVKAYHADHVKHEITYERLNSEEPDTCKLEIQLNGNRNTGLQFFQFNYYGDSDASCLRHVDVKVFDGGGKPRNVMLLPFRIEGKRAIAALVCLDRPLAAIDTIKIVKVEQIYRGLARYERDGLVWQTLSLAEGRTADELHIVTHFRKADFPLHYGDAMRDRSRDAPVFEETTGNQLPTTTIVVDEKPGWKTLSSTVDLSGLTASRNFASVIYYKD
ncbi:patatin-like phospholipase family protein [Rhodanobacter sp. AS-Z3]|uniref:patatin-like phospholipase family protein n=1 Tax=Rhodanobacter sp. AS-Z3 TaxID=3031330 RepID=UPI0024789D4C|nr:patatin-like phospholipase family protein [Rhodanobacter sp. AS-Z3]WEN13906.1 patatin-like phospholipase family protein [Rhodanobacter sp. AS-Z3]